MTNIHSLDGETFLISRSMPAPQSVCWAHDDGSGPRLLLPADTYPLVSKILASGDTLVNHNLVFDAAILCVESPRLLRPFFDAFDAGLARCTMIREQLIRISRGEGRFVVTADDEEADEDAKATRTRFDLASTAWRWLRHFVKKKDTWRLRYRELYGVPLEQWPDDAKAYPLEDASVTRRVYLAQQGYVDYYHAGELPDEVPQNTYAWALKLMSMWGVRTDGEMVARLKKQLTKVQTEAIMALLPKGIFRIGGTRKAPKYVKTTSVIRDKVKAAYEALGESVPATKKGFVSTATKTLKESTDPDLKTLAAALGAMKLLSSFIPVLESGASEPICADYNVLVESGRTSCRKPNMQQMPRLPGVRECFVARPGKAWVTVDYEMAELVAQGQMCLDVVGFSVLADQINAGLKPILAFAAKLAGMSYDEAAAALKDKAHPNHGLIKTRRQDAKAVMYGLPGGMTAKGLWHTMRGAGIDIELSTARGYESAWRTEYPEFPKLFDDVKRRVGYDYGDTGTITQLRSGRIRGGVDYPAGCNTRFQGLVADAAKLSLKRLVRECFLDRESPMFGARPVVFAHDENIVECDVGRVHEVGYRMAEVMKASSAVFMPDVKMEAEPAAMLRWTKDSYAKFENGRLVPCDG